MVHTFSHIHKGTHYYFMWDVESGSLSLVDYVAFLCAKKHYSDNLTAQENLAYQKIDCQTKKEILDNFALLEKEGALNAQPIIKEFTKEANTIKALCLHICHDCNLACEYCFASGGTYHTERDYMTAEVGRKAIDLLIAHSGTRQNLEVDFFGGEPLLSMPVVKEIVSYAREQQKKFNKVFSFTMTTNCLLLSADNISYLNAEMDNIVLSIDGRKEVHNATRKTINGKECYDTILNNALKLRAVRGDKSYYVRGTFTARNLDFSQDILALNDYGFDQISVEPVVLEDECAMALRAEHLDQILSEYERFTEEYIERRKTDKWFNFFHFMIDLDHGPCPNKRLTGCGAGTEYLAVVPTGEIYPCHQFAGKQEYLIGSVFEGITNQKLRDKFAKISVLSKPHCTDCFAKYFCGGGCIANALNLTGSLDGQYKMGCEMTKKRLELSLAALSIEKLNRD